MFLVAVVSFVIALASAGLPPTTKDVITIQSQQHPEVSISYKKTCICDTTVNAYAGYVHMPSSYTGESYNASLFFWYFEARNDPEHAPTTMYFAGVPGESSTYAVVSEGGICTVLGDSATTEENAWSYNQYSNVL